MIEVTIKEGTFVGYSDDGQPVAFASFGPGMDTRAAAQKFAAQGGRQTRLFPVGSEELSAEYDRHIAAFASGQS